MNEREEEEEEEEEEAVALQRFLRIHFGFIHLHVVCGLFLNSELLQSLFRRSHLFCTSTFRFSSLFNVSPWRMQTLKW